MHRSNVSLLSLSVVAAVLILGLTTLDAQLSPPAGAIAHWKSDAGVVVDAAGRLVLWEDQAGGDNDATPEGTFGTSEPQLTCATFPNGEHAVLGFQGDAGLGIENSSVLSVTELSVYAVVGLSPSGGSIFGNLYHPGFGFGYRCVFAAATVPFFYTSGGTELTYGNDAAAPIPGANPGDKHYLSWHASNTALTKQVYVDGVVTTIDYTDSTVPDYQALGYAEDEFEDPIGNEVASIGSFREVGVQFYDGPIAEILVYPSVSPGQRTAVEDYFQEKYGFPGQAAASPPALPPVPPTLLTCTPSYEFPFAVGPFAVELAWNVCGTYTQQRVLRDGNELAVLSGTADSYSDTSPLTGLHTYEVEATIGGSPELSAAFEADFDVPQPQGRILHLAADQGVIEDASGVLTWEDQSPIGGDNHAQHEPAWGDGFAQLTTSEFPSGTHAVIHFEDPVGAGGPTGASMSFLEPAALGPETRSMSIYAVFEVTDGMSSSIFSNYSNIINWGYGFNLWMGGFNQRRVCFFTSAGTPETIHDKCAMPMDSLDVGWHLITATVDFFNGTKRVYVDGVLSAFWDLDQDPDADECVNGDPPGDLCYVGNSMDFHPANLVPAIGSWAAFDPAMRRYNNGGMAELIMYDSVSEEQRLMVEGELMAKYFQGAPGAQLAGDCNQDGAIDLSDVICLLGHLFQGNPEVLPCDTTVARLNLMDCNQDGGIDLSDAIYKLAFLFQGSPGPVQGTDCISISDCPENPGCP